MVQHYDPLDFEAIIFENVDLLIVHSALHEKPSILNMLFGLLMPGGMFTIVTGASADDTRKQKLEDDLVRDFLNIHGCNQTDSVWESNRLTISIRKP